MQLIFPSKAKTKYALQNLASGLLSLSSLARLRLVFEGNNRTENRQFQQLFSNLKSMRALQVLEISVPNEKTLMDWIVLKETLGESLQELSSLKAFSLNLKAANQITNKGIEAIAWGLQGFKN